MENDYEELARVDSKTRKTLYYYSRAIGFWIGLFVFLIICDRTLLWVKIIGTIVLIWLLATQFRSGQLMRKLADLHYGRVSVQHRNNVLIWWIGICTSLYALGGLWIGSPAISIAVLISGGSAFCNNLLFPNLTKNIAEEVRNSNDLPR
jgi:hypothetical protein